MLCADSATVSLTASTLSPQEFIAVSQLNKAVQGKILCFTGPPGGWSHDDVIGRSHDDVIGKSHDDDVIGSSHDDVIGSSHNNVIGGSHDDVIGRSHNNVIGRSHDDVIGKSYHPSYPFPKLHACGPTDYTYMKW